MNFENTYNIGLQHWSRPTAPNIERATPGRVRWIQGEPERAAQPAEEPVQRVHVQVALGILLLLTGAFDVHSRLPTNGVGPSEWRDLQYT